MSMSQSARAIRGPLALAVSIASGCASTGQPAPPHAAERDAPAFSANDAEGQPVRLSDFDGKVRLVDFWASWCEPCKGAMALYDEIQREYGDRIVVLGVSVDDSEAAMRDALRRRPVSFRILWDPSGTIAEQYAVDTMPSSYLVDPRGRIVYTHRGFVPADVGAIRKAIDGALGAKNEP